MLANLQKLLHILNKNQKKKVAGLGVMIFVGALMEMIGVGLIMPVVEGVINPGQLLDKPYIRFMQRFLPFDTANEWLLFLIAAIIGVYIIKNGYLLLQTYVQSRFVNKNQSNTISYMLEEYLNRPYEFYLNADIPTIFRTIDGDVPKVFTTLMEYIQLATELMVSAVLCVTLLITNPHDDHDSAHHGRRYARYFEDIAAYVKPSGKNISEAAEPDGKMASAVNIRH
ncbi:MAG: hypothetical protein ACLR9I_05490 [Eisenbergiella sp.]